MLTTQLAASSSRDPTDRPSAHVIYSSHNGRGSRPDLSFLGIGSVSDRDTATLESRRETKQEREARRAEREKVAREHERERSMREESVDGGYLVTQGVYTGIEDYNKAVVRQLMVVMRYPRNADADTNGIARSRGGSRRFGKGSMTTLILGRNISWWQPSEAYLYQLPMKYHPQIIYPLLHHRRPASNPLTRATAS